MEDNAMTDTVKTLRRDQVQTVRIDTTSSPPMWYAWPTACPMIAAKAAVDTPAPIACQMGAVTKDGVRGYITCCWHTNLGKLYHPKDGKGPPIVPCTYNPETDLWNRPGGKVKPDCFVPQELPPVQ
jgi:hypothetical protein